MKKKKNLQKISGGQAIIESLKVEKVSHVFGLIGSATMELFDALYDERKIKFIDVRDERTGTHMADGYARASGKPGIIIAGQNGPGATNLVTGVAQAKAAFSPLISIAGAVSTKHEGKDSFQEIDQQSLFEPITKKTFSVKKTKSIPKIISEAFCLALTPRHGPVHINFPRDTLSQYSSYKNFKKHKKKEFGKISQDKLSKIINLIKHAKKPVIIAGGGVKNTNCEKKVLEIAKYLNFPIVASAGHGDVMPYNEKLYGGQMGPRGNVIATTLLKKADLIIALGTRLGFNSTFYSYENINKKASIVQIEADKKSIGRYFPITIGIHNDVKKFVSKLHKKILEKKIKTDVSIWTKNFIEDRNKYLQTRDLIIKLKSHPIQPNDLFKILRNTLPKDSVITLDAGTLCLQANDNLNFIKSKSLFTPLDFGLVGFSFACGLGVKLAKPKSPVISLMGDGGFGMTLSELSTAVKHKINTITIVMNNKSWGAEKAYQRDFFNKRYIGANIDSPSFSKIADLYGAKGYYVKKINNLTKILKEALKCKKPVVIDIDVDKDALYSFRKDSFAHKKK